MANSEHHLFERVATCEERLRGLEADVTMLVEEARTNRHGLRSLETAIQLSEGIKAADARRERRLFAIAGLALTAINVGVAVLAVTGSVPG